MAEELKEEIVEEEKKGPLQKLKDKILPDEDEQAAIISTFVRLGVLVWSGGILTLNYVAIPGVPQQKIDPTFIASVFTGVLASFGIQTASKKGDGTMKMNGNAYSCTNDCCLFFSIWKKSILCFSKKSFLFFFLNFFLKFFLYFFWHLIKSCYSYIVP